MQDLSMTLRKLTIGHPERNETARAVLEDLGIRDAAIKALAILLDRSDDHVLGDVLGRR